jgi:methylaspartate ammonia-lyase
MTVYVSNDKNRIPLLIESPVSVGSIKAVLKDYSGLRHELSSKIN